VIVLDGRSAAKAGTARNTALRLAASLDTEEKRTDHPLNFRIIRHDGSIPPYEPVYKGNTIHQCEGA